MLDMLLLKLNHIIYTFLNNIYSKPKLIIRLFMHPSSIYGANYFPELTEKSKFQIFCDQILNIIRYGAIDEYYYLYGLNVAKFRNSDDYIVYRCFMHRRDRLNLSSKHNTSCILRNKLFFGVLAKSLGIDTPENVAYIRFNDVLLLSEGKHGSIQDFLATYKGEFFYKPIDGECGIGVFKLSIDSDRITMNGHSTNIQAVEKVLSGGGIFLVQRCIEQHPDMARLHPSSINSMRMVTVRSLRDGEIHIMPSVLRIGSNGAIVDNTSQGGIAIGFNLETGKLNEYGLRKPQYGLKVNCHPDSKIKFSEFHIPYITEAIEKAIYFHSFLDMHSIGWDIAIGPNGPIFIEGNDNWEINGPQSCNHGLAKEFNEYFYA